MSSSLEKLDKAWEAANQLLQVRNVELANWERYQLSLLNSNGITEAKTKEAAALRSYMTLRCRTVEMECRIRRRCVFFLRIRLNKIEQARQELLKTRVTPSPEQEPSDL